MKNLPRTSQDHRQGQVRLGGKIIVKRTVTDNMYIAGSLKSTLAQSCLSVNHRESFRARSRLDSNTTILPTRRWSASLCMRNSSRAISGASRINLSMRCCEPSGGRILMSASTIPFAPRLWPMRVIFSALTVSCICVTTRINGS